MGQACEDVVVVGGGIAGIAAATALAERQLRVTLVEAEDFLGGRAAAWTHTLSDGAPAQMERGFHAFFRQYYCLRNLLKRVDPNLSHLRALSDYPICGPGGRSESFSNLPKTAPFNVMALTRRTKTLTLRDLMKVDGRAALRMLAFDGDSTYSEYDQVSAADYLDALHFPKAARRMLFEVFAHSFFNPEATMSAGELLMMFHFYFMGNREGLIFDVASKPMSTAFWTPFAAYLRSKMVTIQFGERARSVEQHEDGWRVVCDRREIVAKQVVLAVTVPTLRRIVQASVDLHNQAWRDDIARLKVTSAYAVWRLWLDKPTHPHRHPFVGTSGLGCIDNISLYHQFQDESRQWAQQAGGSVIELHAYALAAKQSKEAVRRELLGALHSLYPETRAANILNDCFMMRRDCPAFEKGSFASRPTVRTPHQGVYLAGDLVRLPFPSALMERAASSGFLAANAILQKRGLRPERIDSVPSRGMFATLMKSHAMFRPRMEH